MASPGKKVKHGLRTARKREGINETRNREKDKNGEQPPLQMTDGWWLGSLSSTAQHSKCAAQQQQGQWRQQWKHSQGADSLCWKADK